MINNTEDRLSKLNDTADTTADFDPNDIERNKIMSYKVTKAEDATPYEAPGHFNVLTTRLHNPEDVNEGVIVNGLSHFEPGGGAKTAPANFEMIYYVIDGEMTVELFDEDGKENKYTLHAGRSFYRHLFCQHL